MCPIHTLWDQFFAQLPDGARPWERVSAGKARERLRQILSRLQVPEWAEYGTHDFRRGHAEARSSVTDLMLQCVRQLSVRTCGKVAARWCRYCRRGNGSLRPS